MSADNGILLKKRVNKFVVSYFSGDYMKDEKSFPSLEEAIQYINDNHNDTEYGITLQGFGTESLESREK